MNAGHLNVTGAANATGTDAALNHHIDIRVLLAFDSVEIGRRFRFGFRGRHGQFADQGNLAVGTNCESLPVFRFAAGTYQSTRFRIAPNLASLFCRLTDIVAHRYSIIIGC
jgi:hypothetical protein